MECDFCHEIKPKEIYACDECQKKVCKNCGKLTSSEVKVLQLSSRVMKFSCQKCVDFDTYELLKNTIEDKQNLIESKDEIIQLLKKKLEELNQFACGESYSQVVKKSTMKEKVLLVKPKDKKQLSEETRKQLEARIEPTKLGVAISAVKYVRDGGVAISYNNEGGEVAVSSSIKKNLGEQYEVIEPEKKNPRIKIINVSKEVADNEEVLVEKIITQNRISTDENKLIIRMIHNYETKKEGRKPRTNIIMEVDPQTYAQLRLRGTISIGWKSCYFVDHVNIVQCYKCWKFGHMRKDCKKEKEVCPHCTEEHKGSECEASIKVCINCKYAAENFGLENIKFDHSAYSKECDSYKRIYMQVQKKYDFPSIYNENNI